MRVHDTFTHRRDQAANTGKPEVYVYDETPKALLGQIILIWQDYFRNDRTYPWNERSCDGDEFWEAIGSIFCREKGLLEWPWPANEWHTPTEQQNVIRFFLDHASNDDRLNLIELVFSFFAPSVPGAAAELNERLKRAGFGYQFEGTQLIRMDSTVAHEEIVKPALLLLGGKGFEKADKQFRSAHAHYRRNEHSQAITEAGKAFESTLKAICAAMNWEYEKGARASDLIRVVVKNNLFPEWLENGLTSYVAMMKTGLPNVRNEAGPHGTAPDAAPVHAYLARYALHLSASNILMVGEAAAKK